MILKWTQSEDGRSWYSEQPFMYRTPTGLIPAYRIRQVGRVVWSTCIWDQRNGLYMPYIAKKDNVGKYREDVNMYRTLEAAKRSFPLAL